MPTIRISDKTHDSLARIRQGGESFDHVVQVLLATYEVAHQLTNTIGPAHYLHERPNKEVR